MSTMNDGLDGTSGNSDCQWASRRFHQECVDYLSRQFFQNKTARMVKANWRQRVPLVELECVAA